MLDKYSKKLFRLQKQNRNKNKSHNKDNNNNNSKNSNKKNKKSQLLIKYKYYVFQKHPSKKQPLNEFDHYSDIHSTIPLKFFALNNYQVISTSSET